MAGSDIQTVGVCSVAYLFVFCWSWAAILGRKHREGEIRLISFSFVWLLQIGSRFRHKLWGEEGQERTEKSHIRNVSIGSNGNHQLLMQMHA